jgi:hypothetical protein
MNRQCITTQRFALSSSLRALQPDEPKFLVRTTYEYVAALSPEDAVAQIRRGEQAYEHHAIEDDPGEFICVISAEEEE